MNKVIDLNLGQMGWSELGESLDTVLDNWLTETDGFDGQAVDGFQVTQALSEGGEGPGSDCDTLVAGGPLSDSELPSVVLGDLQLRASMLGRVSTAPREDMVQSQVMGGPHEVYRFSSEASLATERAIESRKAEDHLLAAEAQMNASVMHACVFEESPECVGHLWASKSHRSVAVAHQRVAEFLAFQEALGLCHLGGSGLELVQDYATVGLPPFEVKPIKIEVAPAAPPVNSAIDRQESILAEMSVCIGRLGARVTQDGIALTAVEERECVAILSGLRLLLQTTVYSGDLEKVSGE